MFLNKIEKCIFIDREKTVIKSILEESLPHRLQKDSHPASFSSQVTALVCSIVLQEPKPYSFNFLILLSQKWNDQSGTSRQAGWWGKKILVRSSKITLSYIMRACWLISVCSMIRKKQKIVCNLKKQEYILDVNIIPILF